MRPSVSIIGAGRVGTALGLALKAANYRVEIVVTKHRVSARRAAKLLGPQTVGVAEAQLDGLSRSQVASFDRASLIIIATPDDSIAPLAKRLATVFRFKSIGLARPEKSEPPVALHTSGAISSEVLKPLRKLDFAIGSLHPLLSISDPKSGADLFSRAFFSVEGDARAVRAARSVVHNLGGQAFSIPADAKALYHAAALTASPNIIALFDIALEMLSSCGLSRRRAQQVLLPLVESTLANLKVQDPKRALTGPFKRGDAATIRKHIAAMRSANLNDALAAYALLGRRSLVMVKDQRTNPLRQDAIARILSALVDDQESPS
jgi:predicted short-subunit dehydrogenase-like oxidoreductase (DUF2520 family)